MSASKRQMHLDLREPSVPRILKIRAKPANDKIFHEVAKPEEPQRRGTRSLHELIEQIQNEDRQRLLEPTSLPKVLRGRAPSRRPKTAIISYAAQAAYERRMRGETVDVDTVAAKFFRQHEAKLDRLARKLRVR